MSYGSAVRSSTQKTPSKNRKLLRMLIGAGTLTVLVAVAPTIVVRVPGLAETLLTRVANVHGSIALGHIQAGWLSPLVIENISIRDQAGNNAVTVEKLSTDKSLISLLLNSSAPGHIYCRHPVVTVLST